MRIIKLGSIPSEEREKTCRTCETVFTYLPIDVKSDFRDGNYIICPLCKGFIGI